MIAICPACQAENDADSAVCTVCGAPLAPVVIDLPPAHPLPQTFQRTRLLSSARAAGLIMALVLMYAMTALDVWLVMNAKPLGYCGLVVFGGISLFATLGLLNLMISHLTLTVDELGLHERGNLFRGMNWSLPWSGIGYAARSGDADKPALRLFTPDNDGRPLRVLNDYPDLEQIIRILQSRGINVREK